eukprot:GILJ01005366.1.p1 GENE.GILJ01005366.1~~GILJ01005366.1.p1  ORF type:complete len:302 (+),score=45.99 GILJ01005366.1:156-1061(+)
MPYDDLKSMVFSVASSSMTSTTSNPVHIKEENQPPRRFSISSEQGFVPVHPNGENSRPLIEPRRRLSEDVSDWSPPTFLTARPRAFSEGEEVFEFDLDGPVEHQGISIPIPKRNGQVAHVPPLFISSAPSTSFMFGSPPIFSMSSPASSFFLNGSPPSNLYMLGSPPSFPLASSPPSSDQFGKFAAVEEGMKNLDLGAAANASTSSFTQAGSSSVMVGKLSREERLEKLRKYREKKKNRVWDKRIRYSCRKNLADRRLRVKGRFVKAGQEDEMKTLADESELLMAMATGRRNPRKSRKDEI